MPNPSQVAHLATISSLEAAGQSVVIYDTSEAEEAAAAAATGTRGAQVVGGGSALAAPVAYCCNVEARAVVL